MTGTAAIASGVQASANFAPGIYTIGGRVPVLTTAANGLSGQFSSITYNSTGVNVRPVLSYDAQDAFLSFVQADIAVPAGTPGNGLSVANALNAVINGGAHSAGLVSEPLSSDAGRARIDPEPDGEPDRDGRSTKRVQKHEQLPRHDL